MTQFSCAHCGRPVQAGNLCADCQALRSYHPDVFYGQTAGPSGGIDKSVIFAVSSVVALAILVGVSWPYLRSGTKEDKKVVQNPPAATKRTLPPATQNDVAYTPPRTYNLPVYSAPPTYAPRAYIPPSMQIPAMPYKPQLRASSAPADFSAIGFQGDSSGPAKQSLPGFIAAYCQQRSEQIGKPVRPAGISMLAGGIGAQLSFDEGGSYRQGTAEFISGIWAWMQRP